MLLSSVNGLTGTLAQLGQQQAAYSNANRRLEDGDWVGGEMSPQQLLSAWTSLGGGGGLGGLVNEINAQGKSSHLTAQDLGIGWDTLMPDLAKYYAANGNPADTTPNTQNMAEALMNRYLGQYGMDANGKIDPAAASAMMKRINAETEAAGFKGGSQSFGQLAFDSVTKGALPFVAGAASGIYGAGTGLTSMLGGTSLPGAFGTSGLGASSLPTWAGGAAEGLGGGAGGLNLGGASLASSGLTTGASVGGSLGGLGSSFGLGSQLPASFLSDLPSWASSGSGSSSFLDTINNYISNRDVQPSDVTKLISSASGGGTGTGGNMTTQATGNTTLDSLLGLGASTLPSLLAWNYFQNLPKPDIGQYQALINKAGDMSGPLGQFDLNSATGRGNLNASLASRGVLGSSFGDQALTNYDTSRDIGRGTLAFGGVGTQGQLLNSMNATTVNNNKNSTDFLGRLLGGLGGAAGSTGAGATGIAGSLSDIYKNIFGGSNDPLSAIKNSTTGVDMTGFANNNYLNDLFGSASTPTQFANSAQNSLVNDGLTLGTGFGTTNPLSGFLGGNNYGMASLSNLWGW